MALRAALAVGILLCAAAVPPAAAEPLATGTAGSPALTGSAGVDASPRPAAQNEPRGADGSPATVERAAVAADMPSASKTMELLLEMQGKNPGLEEGERAKAEMPSGRPPANPLAAGIGSVAPGLVGIDPSRPFGGGAVLPSKPAAADPRGVDWSEAPPSRFGGGATAVLGGSTSPREPYRPPTSAGGSSDEASVRGLIPRALIRFVRENRDMVVLGSLVVLAVLWAATMFASGRKK